MGIQQAEINRLLLDPGFRNWALRSDVTDFEKWEAIIKEDPQLNQIAEQAKELIINIELTEVDSDQKDIDSFDRLKQKQNGQSTQSANLPQISSRINNLPHTLFVRIAAVITFFLIFSGLLYFNSSEENSTLNSDIALIQKQTLSGQQLSITLPDGTKVKLNSDSRVTYPSNFAENRHVSLEGEAYFQVVRDEQHPFSVITDQFQTEVLGTSFNISAYADGMGKISVTRGKVSVNKVGIATGQNQIILEKEEAAEVIENRLEKAVFNINEILWKDGILVFTDESIRSSCSKLERWFNVNISVKNESDIAGEFSGKYSNESLEQILKGMGYAMNFTFQIEGTEILIQGKN